ncbi:MAG: 3-isopropylmalate dehydrogenase, partial [Chloroflexi bacterium]|nr:3-isopropylmalate dehydrogenase [Chloroflexota bacterium]
NAVSRLSGFRYEPVWYPWSSQLYLDTGELMPESTLDEYRSLHAIYLGALGDPRVERGLVERSVIMTIRLGLDLYINLRPIALYAEHLTPLKNVRPEDVDMVVVRENTEDAYVGVGGLFKPGTADEVAIAEMIYTRRGVERTVRYAFELARTRPRRTVTLVDKSNAIRPQEIWRRTFAAVASEYPDITAEALYVDAAAMLMVSHPARFDVVVTTNLFGDILTDLGAAIQGGMGSAASGNIHPGRVSMFEPIHGSAPDIAGKNVASPVGAIAAAAMMLDHLGQSEAARAVEGAIRALLVSRRLPGLDTGSGLSTGQVGDLVAAEVERAVQDVP